MTEFTKLEETNKYELFYSNGTILLITKNEKSI